MCLNKTEDLNLSIFKVITKINELKTLAKHISCKCKCKFDGRKCNSNQKWNNKFQCKCKNLKESHICKKDYIWNPATCSCENVKYVWIIIGNSAIECDEIVGTIKTIPVYFNGKRWPVKQKRL